MNKLISTLLCAVVACQLVACASQKTTQKAPPGYLQKGNGSFQLQPYKEKTLKNGLKLVFIQDSTLP